MPRLSAEPLGVVGSPPRSQWNNTFSRRGCSAVAGTELCYKLKGSFTTSIQAEKSMALDVFCPGKDQQPALLFALQSFGTLREVG